MMDGLTLRTDMPSLENSHFNYNKTTLSFLHLFMPSFLSIYLPSILHYNFSLLHYTQHLGGQIFFLDEICYLPTCFIGIEIVVSTILFSSLFVSFSYCGVCSDWLLSNCLSIYDVIVVQKSSDKHIELHQNKKEVDRGEGDNLEQYPHYNYE